MERSRTTSSAHDDDVPLITSPEPMSYDGGNVAMQQIDSSLYSPPMVTSPEIIETKGGAYAQLNSSTLDVEDGIQYKKQRHHAHHAKRFDHNEARKNLMKTGGGKLLITFLFSAGMCLTLKGWEGFTHPVVLSRIDVRIFNSLTIGISLCLGLNLLASLKHYASFFRWSFLARRYVSLEVFDLILHFGSLAKVTKLMVISMPGLRGKKWLRRFRWFKDVRDDGTKWMWLACLVWLSINIGSQILVALLSLFWPMNNSEIPLLVPGDVSVADLNVWYVDTSPPEDDVNSLVNQTSLEAAWTFGTEAMAYPVFDLKDIQNDLSGLPGTPIYKADGVYHYRFFNRDPARPYTNYLSSSRNVSAVATCEQLEIGNDTVVDAGDDGLYVNARRSGEQEWTQYYLTEAASGSVTWTASVAEHCGPRCTNFTVLQNEGNKVNKTSLFFCNSTLTDIYQAYAANDITTRSAADSAAVYGNDNFARIAAGAIGWTGIPWNSWLDRQSRSYSQGSKWSPAVNVNAAQVEDMLMRFTIGAVAAFDDHGIKYTLTHQTVVPSQGQQLDVDWPYVLCILGGICFIQLLALCLLVLFANRTIVRDDSYFSMAMLLRPVVMKIGESGLNMSGEEIKDHRALRWRRIKYDYKEGEAGSPNQVTISWEGRDPRESRGSWAAGSYS
jgi:hypothetical protein